jgi:hypothetical protein
MKYTLPFIVALYIVMNCTSCEQQTVTNVQGLTNVTVTNTTYDMVFNSDTCAVEYTVQFKDSAGQGYHHWYWASLSGSQSNTKTIVGKPISRANQGNLMTVYVKAHHFENAPASWYDLKVQRGDSLNSRGMPVGYTGKGQAQQRVKLPTFSGACDSCYCTNTATTPITRWYVAAEKSIGDVEAVSAEIKTIGARGLCGIGVGDTTEAFGNMHINVSNTTTGLWGQAGLITERKPAYPGTYTRSYFEARLSEFHQPVTHYAPTDPATDSWHWHEVLIDTVLVRITWVYDHGISVHAQDLSWVLPLGNSVSCTGEVYPRESDMPGVWSNRCISRYIGYRPVGGQGYSNINFTTNDIGSDDPSEFGLELKDYGGTVEIWDNNPLR